MPNRIVVGLFDSKGEADNARRRLETEGIPEGEITVKVLRESGPPPRSMEPEFETEGLDPFFWFLGDLRKHYEDYITNGETAVCVEVPSDDQAEAAASILEMFDPERVDVVTPPPPESRS